MLVDEFSRANAMNDISRCDFLHATTLAIVAPPAIPRLGVTRDWRARPWLGATVPVALRQVFDHRCGAYCRVRLT
jgi:hypothetical protein